MQLSDKVVLVTGGASGLGRGICLVMAQRGAEVAVVDVDPQGAENTVSKLTRGGHKAKAYQGDVTARGELDALVNDAIGEFGRIDALVNAAGVIGAPGFEESTRSREEDWDLILDVNLKGTVHAIEAVAAHMKERRSGKIVNISSHSGRVGSAGNAAYGASKAAVIHVTQSFAMDLAPFDVNVNVVCPGTILTPMWERIAERTRRNNPSKRHLTTRQLFEEAIQERCPLKREQTPEDIGRAVAFFVSDDAKNITGQSLNVNGGTRMD